MEGLRFQTATPPVRSDPARADIACFIGFVDRRDAAAAQRARLERTLKQLGWTSDASLPAAARVLPTEVLPGGDSSRSFPRWLRTMGWLPQPNATAEADLFRRAAGELLTDGIAQWWAENDWLSPFSGRSAADLLELVDVPLPVDTWDAFDALLGWDRRASSGDAIPLETTLGAAVRRFFLQGGRKCYVIRVDDSWPTSASRGTRAALRSRILNTSVEPTAVDRTTWRGVGHLFGLPDASFLCTPDLPELFVDDPPRETPDAPVILQQERFVACATPLAPSAAARLPLVEAPRSSEQDLKDWATFVDRIATLLRRQRREVQYVAAVPLPQPSRSRAGRTLPRVAQWDQIGGIQTAFVQLAYPWLRTRESSRLPGSLEPPDATLVGMLANGALTGGAWRSIARQPVFGVLSLEPVLAPSDLERPLDYRGETAGKRTSRRLRDRISMFSPSPTGFQLLSDVTTDDDEAYRPANVNRLVASLVRAARTAGDSAAFSNNGPQVWRGLQAALEELLLGLWGAGALAGASAAEAFTVRCDRSTTTQADLDAGRVITTVQFLAARPIEQITVVFAMDEGGQVSLVSARSADAIGVPA